TLDWIAQYRSLIGPYAEALKLVRTLQKPEAGLSAAASKALLDEALEAAKKLKTHGRLEEELDRRIARLSKMSGRSQQNAEQRQKMKEQLDHKKRELDQFGELTKTLPTLVRGYDFSPSQRILQEMRFESPEVQNAMEGKRYLYQGAADFMGQLFKDIASQGWQGTVERREGTPITGWVTGATFQDMTISLSRSSTNAAKIPTEQVEPETLIKMAQFFCSTISDTPDYQHRLEMIAIFARMEGLTDVASNVATQLMDESRPFRLRWMKVL
ncbi:MAG: Serine/threonine protein kinase, partial [Verrucomicrobiaceae bacterium]|nr:Serine/threonine protein kinase [Verrucomicrobiaceae bacterium]